MQNLVYLSQYGRPPHYDQAYQVTLSLDMADMLARRPFPAIDKILDVSGFYPPLLFIYTAPLYGLLGRSLYVARASELGFLLILLFSVYGLGRRLGDERTGLLAAALCGLYPIVFGISRLYTNDFPLLALVALATERLWASDGFRRFWPSLQFGLACAAGMLVKWTFICFLVPPAVYALVWQAYQLEPERRLLHTLRDASARWGIHVAFFVAWCGLLYGLARVLSGGGGAGRWTWTASTAVLALVVSALARRVRDGFPRFERGTPPRARESVGANLLAAVLCVLVPAWPWYVRHTDYVMKEAATVIEDMSALRSMPAITEPGAWTYYFQTLLSHQLHLVFFVLALCALAWAFRKGGRPRVYAWLFVAQYVVVSAIRHKDPRYFMPALPLLAALTAWWMLLCLPRRVRTLAVMVALVIGALQLEAITWGSPLPREYALHGVQVWKQHGYGSHEGLGERWPLDEMVQAARQRAPGATPDHPATIALLANSDCVHYEALNAAAKFLRLPVRAEFEPLLDGDRRADRSLWMALAADFILLKTGDPGPAFSLGTLPEALVRLGGAQSPKLPMHDLVQRWRLPDGSQAALYQRRTAPAPPVRFGDVATLERVEFPPADADTHNRRLVLHWSDIDQSRLEGVLVFVHLLRPDGSFVAPYSYLVRPADAVVEGDGGIAATCPLPLPAALAPGGYALALGLWRPDVDGGRIPASNGADIVTIVDGFDVP